ncbi:hypothetical protein NMY22_g9957 [Coprinellus aureogranulatus]|nr:hypothetical protein NMY22_g9957 [Coprinellus aureogranulatus]
MTIPLRCQVFEDMFSRFSLRASIVAFLALSCSVILANALRQLKTLWHSAQRGTKPPEVFHFVPFIGSALAYSINPTNFLASCQEVQIEYGDAFTFTLFGKRVTFIPMEDAEELIEARYIAPSLFADTGDAYLVSVLCPLPYICQVPTPCRDASTCPRTIPKEIQPSPMHVVKGDRARISRQ